MGELQVANKRERGEKTCSITYESGGSFVWGIWTSLIKAMFRDFRKRNFSYEISFFSSSFAFRLSSSIHCWSVFNLFQIESKAMPSLEPKLSKSEWRDFKIWTHFDILRKWSGMLFELGSIIKKRVQCHQLSLNNHSHEPNYQT